MNRIQCVLATLASIAACGGLSACGGDDAVVTQLQVSVWSNDGSEPFPLADNDDPEIVNVFAFRGLEPLSSTEGDFRDDSVRLPTIPFGDDNWLAISVVGDGDNGNNTTLASGATPRRFSAIEGVDIGPIDVFMTRPEQFTRAFAVDFAEAESRESTFELGGASSRAGFSMTELADGRLLVAGGADITVGADGVVTFGNFRDTVEVYDPSSGSWFLVTEPGCFDDGGNLDECAVRLSTPVAFHSASLFSNGQIAFVGGLTPGEGDSGFAVSGEINVLSFESALEGFVDKLDDEEFYSQRAFHTATAVGTDRILLVGGIDRSYELPRFSTGVDELYLEGGELGIEIGVVDLDEGRAAHSAEYFGQEYDGLPHGIIVAGGRNETSVLGSSEVIYLDGGDIKITPGANLAVPRFGAAATTYIAPGDIDDETGELNEYWVLAGGYTAVGSTPGVLNGSQPTGSVENYIVRNARFNDEDGDQVVGTARAFGMAVNFPLSGDLLLAGGIGADGTVLDSGTWLVQREDGADGWYDNGGWAFDSTNFGGTIKMSSPRVFGQAVTLPSMFGFFVGGSNGTSSVTSSDFYNNNDYGLAF
jgi:hypothetical protein